mgnify:CR=1 FL=1
MTLLQGLLYTGRNIGQYGSYPQLLKVAVFSILKGHQGLSRFLLVL